MNVFSLHSCSPELSCHVLYIALRACANPILNAFSLGPQEIEILSPEEGKRRGIPDTLSSTRGVTLVKNFFIDNSIFKQFFHGLI
jgi:hypothetical protein